MLFGANAIAILVAGAVTFSLTGAAATEANRGWRLEWWTIAFAGLAFVELGALVANTTATDELGIRDDMAARVVEEWVDASEYDVQSVDVDDDTVSIVLSGPGAPEDTATLSGSLIRALGDQFDVDLPVMVTEQVTIEPDADE